MQRLPYNFLAAFEARTPYWRTVRIYSAGAPAMSRSFALSALLFSSVVTLTAATIRPDQSDATAVRPVATENDNRAAAGTLSGSEYTVSLQAVEADWFPLAEGEAGATIYAFAETGKSPTVPGPLLRVPQGTRVRVHLENTLAEPLQVHGLSERTGPTLSAIDLQPGESRDITFTADAAGTFYYWATTTPDPEGRFQPGKKFYKDSPLSGAFLVDAIGSQVDPNERIFVIGTYTHAKFPNGNPNFFSELLTINGRPWPFTERLEYEMGDSIRWRLINTSAAVHPMHLHGFYFRVDSRGDLQRDTTYWAAQRRQAVTERMDPGTTMSLVWSPDRPGGWIFHCHLSYHVLANTPLGDADPPLPERLEPLMFGHTDGDPNDHVAQAMGGLMMHMYIRPPEGWVPGGENRRQLRLFIQSDSAAAQEGADPLAFGAPYRRRFAYVLQEGDTPPAPDSVNLPGSTLVFQKGEPTSIWVYNRSTEPTAVHWHGLEIESYYDGVAGGSGYPTMPSPAIMPGDSFEVRYNAPRSGTFMYHTHVNDIRQQSAGLYGAIFVVDDRENWDRAHEIPALIGLSPIDERVHVNGTRDPEPRTLNVGESYRFRLMNITLGRPYARVRLVRDGVPVRWTPRAIDGADLPMHQRDPVDADHVTSIGQTFDFEWTPRREGEYALEVRAGSDAVTQQLTVVDPSADPGGT
jgi:FtsP/CotA-like multicopper oxidase with cupredoxin domain